MRTSTNTVALATSVIAVVLFGCNGLNDGSSGRVSFVSKYAPIEFSFPAGWYENPKKHPYDLQCFSPSKNMNSGVFAYKTIDIATDSTPTDIFREQIADIRSKRKNFQEFEAIQTHEYADKTVTSITYTGEKDSSRNCYRFSLIEFKTDDSKFAVVLQVAIPGEWNKSKSVLEKVTRSARSLPND